MDLSAILNQAIFNISSDEKRRYIGASSIGRPCSREIWYAFNGFDGARFSPELMISFQIGKSLETMILDFLDKTSIVVERPNKVNNFLFVQDDELPIFQGHMDAVIYTDTSCVLEIKTAKHSSYLKFVKQGVKVWSPTYYAQIQAYMGMSGHKKSVILVLNKDTSSISHEWVDFDDIFYHELRAKAKSISLSTEAPERINKNPVFLVCNKCRFKSKCHGGE